MTQEEVQARLQRVMAPMVANLSSHRNVITARQVRALTDEANRQAFEMTDGAISVIGVKIGMSGAVAYLISEDT